MTSIPLRPCEDRPRSAPLPSPLDVLGEAARRTIVTARLWRERVRGRNDLARLDARMLDDIGLTPSDRDFLVNKPFWRE